MTRPEARANRRRTMNLPWSERGDFVEECIKEKMRLTGDAYSRVMFETLELYFAQHSEQGFYDRVDAMVSDPERKEGRKHDIRYREFREPGGDGYIDGD